MKKMIMGLCCIATAATVNAASVNWKSGEVKIAETPSNLTTGNTLNNNAGLWIFKLTQAQYDSINQSIGGDYTAASAALWAGFTGSLYAYEEEGTWTMPTEGKLKVGETSINSYAATGMWGESAEFSGDAAWTASNGETVYAALIVGADTDGDYKIDYYSANIYEALVDNAYGIDVNNAALKWNTAEGTATTWQSVPEPTSGLLLLLGVAGLALRRRRA